MGTEISLDVSASGSGGGVSPSNTCVLRLAKVDDGNRSVWLTLVQDRTFLGVYQWHLGLTGAGLDAMAAYDLFVDYRVTVFGQIAEVLVQRTSDFQYWDQGGGAWAVGEISSALPAAMTRQYAHATMTNILSGVAGDSLLVRVRCVGGAPAHSVMIYKVLLKEV